MTRERDTHRQREEREREKERERGRKREQDLEVDAGEVEAAEAARGSPKLLRRVCIVCLAEADAEHRSARARLLQYSALRY